MESNVNEQVKSTELFMISHFMNVMDVINSYKKIDEVKEEIKNRKKIYLNYIKEMSNSKDFFSLNLYNENIDIKIEKCSQIYCTNEKYKKTLEKLENKYNQLEEKLENSDKIELQEIKKLIYDLCNFNTHLAYKIGLVDGMKVKK